MFSLESWLYYYFNKNSGRRCRPRPTKVSLKPQKKTLLLTPYKIRSDASKTAGD
ncbi:MAG: hypothetical protein ACK55Z_06045 [bacterium]